MLNGFTALLQQPSRKTDYDYIRADDDGNSADKYNKNLLQYKNT